MSRYEIFWASYSVTNTLCFERLVDWSLTPHCCRPRPGLLFIRLRSFWALITQNLKFQSQFLSKPDPVRWPKDCSWNWGLEEKQRNPSLLCQLYTRVRKWRFLYFSAMRDRDTSVNVLALRAKLLHFLKDNPNRKTKWYFSSFAETRFSCPIG